MWFWGRNELAQGFGLSLPADRSSPIQLGSEAKWTKMYGAGGSNQGATHCGAAIEKGTLWMWGNNW